jgi:hypothetical protein
MEDDSMHCRETTEIELFPAPVQSMSVHLSWAADRGWTVHVFHRHEGQLASAGCPAEAFDQLTFREAGQVVDDVVRNCLPWLEDQR